MIKALAGWLGRWWFLVALALLLFLGFRFCAPLSEVFETRLPARWRDGVMAAVLFGMALPIDASLMWRAVRRPQAVILATLINFGLLPLIAWLIAPWLRTDLGFGLMVAASVPSTIASAAVWTRIAGGNDAVALQVTMLTNLICFLVTPAWLLASTGADVALDPLPMIQKLALLAVLPTFAAQLARLFAPLAALATRRKALLGVLGQCGILSMVLDGAVSAGIKLKVENEMVAAAELAAMLAAVIFLHLSMLWAGHALGRTIGLEPADRVAVGFAGSQKTLMIGLNLALTNFGGLAMLPMVSYHIVQLLLDAVIANRIRLPARPPG